MTLLDITEIVFLVIVVAVGVGGIIYVVKNDKK
ncbi:MAG: hypothetical protein MUP09_10985 [Thiovulaceae bacterium]|nr:hypothetical protein [Sulfurimonadaceae bacterium]